ncbi:hypothetical protein GKZ90_0003785 [Flavobacterium sp. MC2016-06]|jgi:hypothetical protein|uniref:hypothetical protein n=1 Tax=Flavobacterium sp. MC2016-06 TaxID=2676308 RepID=UPI0012BA5BA8|nr:hypothetical protein [Flavobacterium sp. MC2016-06]MBU3859644.1 hypothetical protein [Flavobacterium sp. MC2016-06]
MEKYNLRQLVNNKGYLFNINFEVNLDRSKDSGLVIIYEADQNWENTCRAGIAIFYDYFSRKTKGQLTVKIIETHWLPVDTNNLIVLFATIKALSESLNFKIDKLEIDSINETFIFPEPRSL